ncbi:MAG: hypothetical protein AAF471_01450 [Myxococcota bacterium]
MNGLNSSYIKIFLGAALSLVGCGAPVESQDPRIDQGNFVDADSKHEDSPFGWSNQFDPDRLGVGEDEDPSRTGHQKKKDKESSGNGNANGSGNAGGSGNSSGNHQQPLGGTGNRVEGVVRRRWANSAFDGDGAAG